MLWFCVFDSHLKTALTLGLAFALVLLLRYVLALFLPLGEIVTEEDTLKLLLTLFLPRSYSEVKKKSEGTLPDAYRNH